MHRINVGLSRFYHKIEYIWGGEGIVYEIKTEFDNIERLNNQIEDYYKAFKFVYVVTCERHYDKIIDIVNECVGIIILTSNNRLRTMRTAKEKSSSLLFEVSKERICSFE